MAVLTTMVVLKILIGNRGGIVMKKILSVLINVFFIGIASFQYASCSKEDVIPSPQIKKLVFNVTVNNTTAPDTKVVKTAWADGDKIFAFFNVDGAGHLDAMKYVTLTYSSSEGKWIGSLSGNLSDANDLGSAGTMYGVHFPFGEVAIASDGASGVTFRSSGNANPELNGLPIYTYYLRGSTSYSIETTGDVATLTGTFNLSMPDDYVYFFVDKNGEQYCSNEKYRLSAEGLIPAACTSFSAGSFSESTLNAGHTVWGYAFNDSGIAFSGKLDATWATPTNHRFYLYSEDGGTLSKTFNKALSSHQSVRLNLTSGWTNNGYRGYVISKGFLIRNKDGTYGLTPGTDPFEIYNYFGKNENKNKVFFQFYFLKGDGELGADGDNINATSAKLPAGWKFPSACYDSSDWCKIVKNAPSAKITIQNADDSESEIPTGWYGKEMGYAFVVVTKEAKTYFGMVLLRDGSYIPKECGIQHWGKGSAVNNISYEQLQALQDAGCCFFSSTGCWCIDSWRYIENNSNVECNYMSSTYTSSKWYRMEISNYSSPSVSASTGTNSSEYVPVRLVREI